MIYHTQAMRLYDEELQDPGISFKMQLSWHLWQFRASFLPPCHCHGNTCILAAKTQGKWERHSILSRTAEFHSTSRMWQTGCSRQQSPYAFVVLWLGLTVVNLLELGAKVGL